MKLIDKKINIKKRQEFIDLISQFIKFGMVGLSNTVIHLLVYYFLLWLKIHYLAANLAGFVISVLNAYYWNRKYVFHSQAKEKERGNVIKSMLKVYFSYGMTFVLSSVLLLVWVDFFHISSKAAPMINLVITIPFNFLLNKFWAMKG